MGFAESFRSLDFLEQVTALQKLKDAPVSESLPELTALFIEPMGDDAADTMVRNTLREVYLATPSAVVEGLASSHSALQRICLDIAGELGVAEAVPQLVDLVAAVGEDSESLLPILTALSRIGGESSLPPLREHMKNSDPIVAAFCVQALGTLGDASCLAGYVDIIEANGTEDAYEVCEVSTWKAIEALGALKSDGALASLGRFLHHRNPTARRIVLETLAACGEMAIPHVAPALVSGDTDSSIMAANILRDIQHKNSAVPLLDALEKGAGSHPNVAFAVYEALGHTPGQKSLAALLGALPKEGEPSTLMAVVQALETQTAPEVGERVLAVVTDRISAQDSQGQRILEAVIAARAMHIFSVLYGDAIIGRILISLVLRDASPVCKAAVVAVLREMGTDQAERDIVLLERKDTEQGDDLPCLLAIDDSVAMRNFYQAHGAAIGFSVTVAEHGREALDIIESVESPFAIVVVDMNMPVMDGIEFTGKLRSLSQYESIPVLMATTESGKSQAQLARKSGVSSFLPKPFTPEMLQNRLRKLLARS